MKHKLLRKNKWIWIELASAVIIIIFLLLLAIWFQESKKNLKVKETSVYYDLGKKVTVSEGSQIRMEDDRTILKTDNETVEVESVPVISEDEDTVTLTAAMAYVNAGKEFGMSRINYYAKIYEKNGTNYVQDGKNTKALNKGFLFDGKDLYLFLEPVILIMNDKQTELGALSYVRIQHNQSIEAYNSKTGKYTFELSDETAVRVVSEKEYELNLDNDMLIRDGSEQILFSNVSQLPLYQGDK